eukprot:scaffold311756_cov30-Tisochrysis_lutea.AAC.1
MIPFSGSRFTASRIASRRAAPLRPRADCRTTLTPLFSRAWRTGSGEASTRRSGTEAADAAWHASSPRANLGSSTLE